MPSFACKKDMWDKPVTATNEQGAAAAFKCDECALFPKQCEGYGARIRKDLPADDKIRLALQDLLKTSPANRRTRGKVLVKTYREEILAARKAGHGWRQILETFQKAGIKISYSSLSRYLREQE